MRQQGGLFTGPMADRRGFVQGAGALLLGAGLAGSMPGPRGRGGIQIP